MDPYDSPLRSPIVVQEPIPPFPTKNQSDEREPLNSFGATDSVRGFRVLA